ncbi:Alkaline shock protein 23 [compost metagenome]
MGGKVVIADSVVATIVGLAAAEVEGVAAMSGGISEGIARALTRTQIQKGIKVEVGTTEAAIDIRAIFWYGVDIPSVCKELQSKVAEAVNIMTGLHVVEVNVTVDGISIKQETTQSESEDVRVK